MPLFKTVWDSLAFLCSLKPMLDWKKESVDDVDHQGLQDNWSENALQLWKNFLSNSTIPRVGIHQFAKKTPASPFVQWYQLFCWKQGSQSKYEKNFHITILQLSLISFLPLSKSAILRIFRLVRMQFLPLDSSPADGCGWIVARLGRRPEHKVVNPVSFLLFIGHHIMGETCA